jgi:hypothetical protein
VWKILSLGKNGVESNVWGEQAVGKRTCDEKVV